MSLDSTDSGARSRARLAALHRLAIQVQEAGDEAAILRALDEGLGREQLTAFIGRHSTVQATLTICSPRTGAGSGEVAPGPRVVAVDRSPLLQRVVRGRETLQAEVSQIADLLPAAAGPARDVRRRLPDLGGAALAPMVARDRVSGLLIVLGEALGDDEALALSALARHLAVALEHASMLGDLKEALLRQHAVVSELRRFEALVAESAHGEAEVALRRIVNAAAEALGVDRAALLTVPEGQAGQTPVATLSVDPTFAALLTTALAGVSDPLAAMIAQGTPTVIADTRTAPFWSPLLAASERAGIRSAWFVPLVGSRGERLGALAIFSAGPSAPSAEQLELARRYAAHAVRAMQRDRRDRRAVEAARAEALIELARSVPHEVGQPLAIIAGYAELIAVGLLEGDQLREACRELVAAAKDLADIVQRLGRVNRYAVKGYGEGRTVIDLRRAAEQAEEPPH